MLFIGIDPGLDGAVAVTGACPTQVWDTPTVGQGKRTMDLRECHKVLAEQAGKGTPVMACIERVHAMPKQGVASVFTFGQGYGSWLALLAANGIAYQEVTPQSWKKHMLEGTDKSKDAAVKRAMSLFPGVPLVPKGCRVARDGRAEALLMAEFARRMYVHGG